ncbi:MAG: HDIG domain-containing metalloprotein [Dehalococcoidia bacterium]
MPSLRPPLLLLFGVVLAAGLVVAIFPFFPRQLSVSEGDVATRDIRSPGDETFESDVLTEDARAAAAGVVRDVLVPAPEVRSAQLAQLDELMNSIGQVRTNDALDQAAKRRSLIDIISRDSTETVLALSDERWQEVRLEAGRVLGTTLSQSIPPSGAQPARDQVIESVSADFAADEANLVAGLVGPLIEATLVVDEEATEQAREVARQSVDPQVQSISRNQIIVEESERIDATAVEVMREVGLLSPRVTWENLTAAVMIAFLATAVLVLYIRLFPSAEVGDARNLVLLALIIAVPVLVARLHFSLVLPDEERLFLAYFLPLPAVPMLIATLLGARLGIVAGLVQATLMMFAVISLPDLSLVETIEPVDAGRVFLVYGLGAVMGVYAVHRAERANQYVAAGVLVGLVAMGSLFAMWLLEPEREAFDTVWMVAAASVNGLGSGLLTAGGFVVVAALLGVTTRVQLMELAQLNAPLLRRLQDEAPGTFHHSIIVGNLAERAADLIGADALLVRVGCYYHDLGKVVQPGYYIENQMAGDNPHDTMDPRESARIIAQHVKAGVELAERSGLPARVRAFIPEHHGTRLIPFFYRKASELDPNVDQVLFRYPGPKPQSRETAIVMLADSTEATARASEDRSSERIDQIVEEVIAERLNEGELEECDLTLRDLRTIAASFKQTLRGVYHPRIAYPEPTARERGARLGRFRPGRRAGTPFPEASAPTRGGPAT